MGQQQLILLALSVVIVGVAIVVGIRAFTESNYRNNADVLMQDAVRISNDLQAWKQKPAPFGGQAAAGLEGGGTTALCDAACLGDPADFTGATFTRLGYQNTAGIYTNLNGEFQITEGPPAVIIGQSATLDNRIQITVLGLTDGDINGEIVCLGGALQSDGSVCDVELGTFGGGAP